MTFPDTEAEMLSLKSVSISWLSVPLPLPLRSAQIIAVSTVASSHSPFSTMTVAASEAEAPAVTLTAAVPTLSEKLFCSYFDIVMSSAAGITHIAHIYAVLPLSVSVTSPAAPT